MRKITGHAAAGVVFSQAIGAENIGEAGVATFEGIRVIRTLHLFGDGIHRYLRIERIAADALQRLVMRGQWPIFQAAGNPDPSSAIRMHDERLIASQGIIAPGIFVGLVIWRLLFGEIRNVVAGPFFLFLVPPDQLLALAPRLAIRTRRCPVVENSPVTRPGIAPAVPVQAVRLTL